MFWLSSPPPECVRYRLGIHHVHRSGAINAWLAGLGRVVLHHAILPRPLLHVRQCRGRPVAPQGPQSGAGVDA